MEIDIAVDAMPANAVQAWVKPAQANQIMDRKGWARRLSVPGLHLAMAKAKGTTKNVADRAARSFIDMDEYEHKAPSDYASENFICDLLDRCVAGIELK